MLRGLGVLAALALCAPGGLQLGTPVSAFQLQACPVARPMKMVVIVGSSASSRVFPSP